PASSDSPPYLRRSADADDRLIRERYSARRSRRLRVVAPAFARSYGFLFSGPRQSELVSEVQCCLVQGQLVDRRPEVEHVSHRRALGMETTEHILAQVHRERSTAVCRLSVHRTRSTKLLASGVQLAGQAEMFEDLAHGHLVAEECKVHHRSLERGQLVCPSFSL